MRLVLGAVLSLTLLAGPAGAQAAQRYAAPNGTGSECTQKEPCSLADAANEASNGDEVIVTAGDYTISAAPLNVVYAGLQLHGDFGGPMPRVAASLEALPAINLNGKGSSLSYLEVFNEGTEAVGIRCQPETRVERVRATGVGEGAAGLVQYEGCTVRDSLLRGEKTNSIGLESLAITSGAPASTTRNVTAIASGENSVGIRSRYSELSPGSHTLILSNSIASGSELDMRAVNNLQGPGNIAVSNSNFDNVSQEGAASISGPANQLAPPLFVDAAAATIARRPGSPTIDAGSTDGIGSLDLAGNPRVLGPAPDIGAFEFVPSPSTAALTSLTVSPRAFLPRKGGGAIVSKTKAKGKRGTTVRYALTSAAKVELTVERALKGRRVGGKCRKQTAANREKKRCTRYRPLKGGFSHQGAAGQNRFKFSGRMRSRALKPGSHRLVGRAGDSVKRAGFQDHRMTRRDPPRNLSLSLAVVSFAFAALFASLLLPNQAAATIYCVAEPSCPQGGLAEATLAEAVEAADEGPAPDTVRIGPGEFTSGPVGANTEIDIVGAGRDATHIVADQTVNANDELLSVSSAGSSVSNLELRLTKSDTNGLRLSNGADVSDLAVRAASSLTEMTGIFVEQGGTEATRLDIRLGPNPTSQAIYPGSAGIVTDSFLQAGIGIGGGNVPAIGRRLHIRAATGIRPFGDILTIRDSVVEPHPESSHFVGVEVNSSNGGPETPGVLVAVNVTIVGNGELFSAGVLVRSNTGDASANLLNSIVANVDTSLSREEKVGDDVDLTARYTSYDKSKVALAGSGTGSDTFQNNLDTAPDSGFVNGAGADYRLRPDSILVDAGNPVPPTSESDFRGLPRVRDGNADGISVADIGAFEYQRVPPNPAFSFTPAVPLFGDLVSFDGSDTSDVDGDPLTLSWSLGDGAAASGALASRLYALPGTYQAALTATDSTGLSAAITHPVSVGLRKGRCANKRKGTGRADRVKGFPAGDRLDGLGGNDVLNGGKGQDCLFGRAGDDRLKGGAGRDRLDGGAGTDVLDVRGGGRDRADCGPGRGDRVLADKRDRLRRCERVKLP